MKESEGHATEEIKATYDFAKKTAKLADENLSSNADTGEIDIVGF